MNNEITRYDFPIIGKLQNGETFRLGDKLVSFRTADVVVRIYKGKVYADIVGMDIVPPKYPIEEFVKAWGGLTVVGNVNIIEEHE